MSGLHRLERATILRTAGFERSRSVLGVDGDAAARALERLAWVRTARVRPQLPDRVVIDVDEWRPVALLRTPDGDAFLSDQGRVIAPGRAEPGLPVVVAAGAQARPGTQPLDPQLLVAITRIQPTFPTLYPGQSVDRFELDCSGALTVVTTSGVKVIFGRVLTPEQYAALPAKLSALKAIAADPEVQKGPVEYINLENANQGAVRFKGDKPPSPSPAPKGASPSPAPTPPATPVVPVPAGGGACR